MTRDRIRDTLSAGAVWMITALLVPITAAAAGLPAGVRYASPVPSASHVMPGSVILLRFDRRPAGDPSQLAGALTVSGSLSGRHAGTIARTADGHLLRFTPDRPFAWGDRVSVTLSGPLAPLTGSASYAFDVSPAPPPPLPASVREVEAPAPIPPIGASTAPPAASTALADTLPLGFPAIETSLTGTTAPGRLFLASFSFAPPTTPYLLIVDDDGRLLYYQERPGFCTDFKLQPDGHLTFYDTSARKFFVMDSSYAVVDSIHCGNGYSTDLHELRLLPDGHALLMSYDPETVDMSQVVPGGNPSAVVVGLVIQELDAGRNVLFQWRSWDHFEITDATHEDLTAARIDYVHGNALAIDGDGNLLLSSRHMDEITKIDRQTGAILWRMGGKHNEFAFLGDTLKFSHQHAVRRLPNGDLTLFDNGNFHDPPFSRAVEYEVDEAQRTARSVWEYRATPDIYGNAMGYVQRLPNGNTLIGWGTGKPDVVEVAPDGSQVMTLTLPEEQHSYRAFRYDWAPADSTLQSEAPSVEYLSVNHPNPFRATTELYVNLPVSGKVSLRVYDLQGREIATVFDAVQQSPGVYRARLDLGGRPSGIYFCRLTVGSHSETRPIVLSR